MALLWCDGFDHYGVTANMTEGAWAAVGAGTSVSTANPRTGTSHLRYTGGALSSTRRVLGGAKTTVGIGGAFFYSNLPASNNDHAIFQFRDAANAIQVTVALQSTGTISIIRGGLAGTELGVSASPVVVAGAYQHIEAMVFFSQTVGTVEVRVNGVTVISLVGQDTVASSLVECSQVTVSGKDTPGTLTITVDTDDLFCYDDTGSFANTFIGDRRVLTLFPNADTTEADWAITGSGTGFGAINQATPDGDTTYIAADDTADVSEFDYQDLPAGVSAVTAVVAVNMSRKTEAGAANLQVSAVQGVSATPGTDRPVTEVYTYWQDVFHTDPDSAAPFTAAEVDSLKVRFARTL